MKKCVYCGCQLEDKSVIDCCQRCGEKVWGKKMFEAIRKNMEDAEAKGNLSLYKDPINQQIQPAPSVNLRDLTKGVHSSTNRRR